MNEILWKDQVVKTIKGFGYRLLELQFQPRSGLIRLFIERRPDYIPGKFFSSDNGQDNSNNKFSNSTTLANIYKSSVTIDDCAFVSNHLSRLFAVENINYRHLEVSSAGIDRKIYNRDDFIHFSGMPIKLKLKQSVENNQGKQQKHFQGVYRYSYQPPEIKIYHNNQEFDFDFHQIASANLDEEKMLGLDTKNHKQHQKSTSKKTGAEKGAN